MKEKLDGKSEKNSFSKEPKQIKKELNGEREIETTKPSLLKGVIFNSQDKITDNKFTDFINEDYAKLDDETYMYFWNNGKAHQEVEDEIKSKYKIENEEGFATSLNFNGELDVYDIDNNFNKHKRYAKDIEYKAKKLFETNRTNRNK